MFMQKRMHEVVTSRSSTPECEYVKPGVTETLELLQKWNLSELRSIFKEHDITLRSLIYLTEEEICELIPKIGVRTIFRAMLKEWRQTYEAIAYPRASTSSLYEAENNSYLHQIELKTECNPLEIGLQNYTTDQNEFKLQCLKQNHEIEHNSNNSSNTMRTLPDGTKTKKRCSQLHYEGKPFIVLDILNGYTDGKTVLEYYRNHNFLDIKNRKRIVNILIRIVVERKVEKYTALFHDITRQLLQIFPSEKYETYLPHNGPNSARGALYYRYSNYTRQLRKEGILAYKKKEIIIS